MDFWCTSWIFGSFCFTSTYCSSLFPSIYGRVYTCHHFIGNIQEKDMDAKTVSRKKDMASPEEPGDAFLKITLTKWFILDKLMIVYPE